jgi:predicted RNA-binding protein with PUA-like domain
VSGIVGLVEISREAYTDPTQFDAAYPHFDARSSRSDPT